jgi:hypothetical protein
MCSNQVCHSSQALTSPADQRLKDSQRPVTDKIDFVFGVPLIEQSRPSGDTGSEQAIQTIKSWIHNCTHEHHRDCGVRLRSQLLKRVIKLSKSKVHLRKKLDNE